MVKLAVLMGSRNIHSSSRNIHSSSSLEGVEEEEWVVVEVLLRPC